MKKQKGLALLLILVLGLSLCLSACGIHSEIDFGNWIGSEPVVPAMPELDRDGFIAAAENLGAVRSEDMLQPDPWVDEQGREHPFDEATAYFSPADQDYQQVLCYFDCADPEHAQHLYEEYYNMILEGGYTPNDLSGEDFRAFWAYGDDLCAFGLVVQKNDRVILVDTECRDTLRIALDGANWSALELSGLENYQSKVSGANFGGVAERFGYELEGQYDEEPLVFPDGDHYVALALNYERWNGKFYYCRLIAQYSAEDAKELFDAEYDYYYNNHRMAFNAVQTGGNYRFFWSEDDIGVVLQVENTVIYVTGESRDQIIQIMTALGYGEIYW